MRNAITNGFNVLVGMALLYVVVQGTDLRDQAWTFSRLAGVAVGWIIGLWIIPRLPFGPAERQG